MKSYWVEHEETDMNSTTRSELWDEKSLIRTASTGDLEAFNQLVLAYQDIAYNHAYALLGDSALAEDATQTGFINAFQSMSAFRGGSFRSWLLKIVKNSAYDILRRSQRHPTQPLFPVDEDGEELDSAPWLADPSVSVESAVEQQEFSREIYRMLDELPDVYRSVLILIDVHGLDYIEATQALQIPIGTVKSRLARARLQMQQRLKESMGSERGFLGNKASLAV
jgi:RNA polymerase sigma-70 factor (ECF subfamily)